MQVRGSLCVITGGSSGIGAAAADALAAGGARVVLLARGEAGLSEVAGRITRAGGHASYVVTDAGDPEAVSETARRILSDHGTPDLLLNNAGAGRFLFLEETAYDELESMMRVPYMAAALITKAFVPHMVARGTGRVAFVNSPGAYAPWPGSAGYCAARFALRGLTQAMRAELHGTGVGVTSAVFGKVTSDYFANNPGSEDRLPKISRIIPTISPSTAAAALVGAIERDRVEVYAPFMLRVMASFSTHFPRLTGALVTRTGVRRPAMRGGSGEVSFSATSPGPDSQADRLSRSGSSTAG